MLKRSAIILLILLQSFWAYSINPPNPQQKQHGFSLKVLGGSLQYHKEEIKALGGRPSYALEFSYLVKGNGSEPWHRFYGYPTYGAAYQLMYLGNTKKLGYSHSIYPFMEIPIVRVPQRFETGFAVGAGVAYISKVYHPQLNADNIAVSSHWNVFIPLRINSTFYVTERFSFGANLSLHHFSNGNIKKPNSGLNYIMYGMEGRYGLNTKEKKTAPKPLIILNKHRISLYAYGFYKEVKTSVDTKFPVGTLSIEYDTPLLSHWRVGGGMDFTYDLASKYTIDISGIEYDSQWQTTKWGVTLTTELMFHRLSAAFALGVYTYNLNPKDDRLYQRVGLRYNVTNRFRLHLALKTHLNVADHIEFGVGYTIW